MAESRFEVSDVDAVVPMVVSKDGRLSGLKEFAGKRVLVVVRSNGPL